MEPIIAVVFGVVIKDHTERRGAVTGHRKLQSGIARGRSSFKSKCVFRSGGNERARFGHAAVFDNVSRLIAAESIFGVLQSDKRFGRIVGIVVKLDDGCGQGNAFAASYHLFFAVDEFVAAVAFQSESYVGFYYSFVFGNVRSVSAEPFAADGTFVMPDSAVGIAVDGYFVYPGAESVSLFTYELVATRTGAPMIFCVEIIIFAQSMLVSRSFFAFGRRSYFGIDVGSAAARFAAFLTGRKNDRQADRHNNGKQDDKYFFHNPPRVRQVLFFSDNVVAYAFSIIL